MHTSHIVTGGIVHMHITSDFEIYKLCNTDVTFQDSNLVGFINNQGSTAHVELSFIIG